MARLVLFLVLLGLPRIGLAACEGTDLRTGLSPAEQAAMAETLMATPYGSGNHWIATRDGQTLHLIGTIHVTDPRMSGPETRLAKIIAETDLMLVEATEADLATAQQAIVDDPSLAFLTTGPTLPDLLPEADWQLLRLTMRDRGMPSFMTAKSKPWMLAVHLGLPTCLKQMTDATNGLDKRLMAHAAAAAIPVLSLEGPMTLFRIFNGDPIEKDLRHLMASLPLAALSNDQFTTLTNIYFEQTTAQAWYMTRLMGQRHVALPRAEINAALDQLEERLMTRRNHAWMEVIRARSEPRIVIAVGALHLIGPDGVPALLEADGFTLHRATF